MWATSSHRDMHCKMPRQQRACFSCRTQWVSNYVYIFTSYCEGANNNTKNQTLQDARSIARVWQWKVSHATIKSLYAADCKDNDIEHIFDFILQGSKRWQIFVCITREKVCILSQGNKQGQGTVARVWQWWPTTHQSNFYMLLITMITATSSYCKKRQQQAIFNVVSQEKQQQLYFWCCTCNNNELTIARYEDATTKHFIRCWLWGWQQQEYLGMLYHKKQWQRWSIARRECEIAPSNYQPNIYVASRKWATIAKQQNCWCNNHVLHCVAKGYNNGNNS